MIHRAVARHLAAIDGSGLVFAEGAGNGTAFAGRFPSIAEPSIGVFLTGGLPEMSTRPTNHPTLQIMVRGDVDDQPSADTLAYWVIDQLTCLDGIWLDQDGPDEEWLIGCTAVQSDPVDLGLDDATRCYERSTNFQLHTHHPTTHRPSYPRESD